MASSGHDMLTRTEPAPPDYRYSPPPVIEPGHTYATVSDQISAIVLTRRSARLGAGDADRVRRVNLLMVSVVWLLIKGPGIWGLNQPVGWAFDITNFVWWIGIGHAGTLISAILLLFRQQWRTSINRFAEAMTIFAVMCAGMFPLLHVGRPWLAYWLLPYPNTMSMWPQFRSPLEWDVFAVSTYATVSLLFWYVGLIPDLATLRDRATHKLGQVVYGVLSLGWRGSAMHWQRYESAYLLLAGISTPLVLSVHSVISFDFAGGQLPGWHTTIFPPYFVAGAVFGGFAMVLTLGIPIRYFYKLEDFITDRHLENMGKVMLTTGLIVVYGYTLEVFMGFYSGNQYERFLTLNRMFGPVLAGVLRLWFCNAVIPQFLWIKRFRRSPFMLWWISIVINVGMWLERFVIIVISLHRDFLPSSWGWFRPTVWDWGLFIGTLGFFSFMMFMFIRLLPMISVFELRELVNVTKARKQIGEEEHGDGNGHVGEKRRDDTSGLATRQADIG
jgi:molybdopterin-containing oxidoreductase family membrane subunit